MKFCFPGTLFGRLEVKYQGISKSFSHLCPMKSIPSQISSSRTLAIQSGLCVQRQTAACEMVVSGFLCKRKRLSSMRWLKLKTCLSAVSAFGFWALVGSVAFGWCSWSKYFFPSPVLSSPLLRATPRGEDTRAARVLQLLVLPRWLPSAVWTSFELDANSLFFTS